MQNSATLSSSVLKKAIDRYYKQLHDYQGRADYELAVISPEAHKLLARFDERSVHYEVADRSG